MKKTILILNCCPLGENEIQFWNSFYEKNSNTHNFMFFSTNLSDHLKIKTTIKINYDFNLSDFIHKNKNPVFDLIAKEIAHYENIWGMYDLQSSIDKAYSWLFFWHFIMRFFLPTGVYVWNGYHIPELALLKTADFYGVKKYYMERGPFGKTFICDNKGFNYSSSFIENYDLITSKSRIENISKFSKVYFQTGVSNWEQPELCKSKKEFINKYKIPEDKHLIFFPAQIDNDANSKLFSPYFNDVYAAFNNIIDALDYYSDKIYLIAKSHPKETAKMKYKKIQSSLGKWIDDCHIFDCLKYSDAIISINSASAVEGALLCKPILILGNSILSPHQHIIRLSKKEGLKKTIDKIIQLIGKNSELMDFNFFDKLLFQYLYTAYPDFEHLGIQSVSKIPLPLGAEVYNNKLIEDVSFPIEFLSLFFNLNYCTNKYKYEISQYKSKMDKIINIIPYPLRGILKKIFFTSFNIF